MMGIVGELMEKKRAMKLTPQRWRLCNAKAEGTHLFPYSLTHSHYLPQVYEALSFVVSHALFALGSHFFHSWACPTKKRKKVRKD